jgi:phenylacetate-CoA ligase
MNFSTNHYVDPFKYWTGSNSFYSSSFLANEKKIHQAGVKKTLSLFHAAAEHVPAYKDFLRKNNIAHKSIKSLKDYEQVPVTTKENYIDAYAFADISWDGKMSGVHMVSTSSGTTGKPYFWSRNVQSVVEGAFMHELLFKHVYHLDKKSTLFLNGFALGRWIAGTFTLECTNFLTWKGYPLVSMTPGYDAEAIIEVLQQLPYHFDQIIIAGFVPFLKELAEMFEDRGIEAKKLNIHLLGTGQGITEKWREYVRNLIGNANPHAVANLYGSADAALMGIETPLSIQIRQKIANTPKLYDVFFGENRLPSLYNFDPRLTYFESIEQELHITKYSGVPLIRYNIHDKGGIITHSDIKDLLSKNNLQLENQELDWKLPFVYLFGRDKFMVKIYGANVYGEHVTHALSHEKLQKLITGKYHLELEYDAKNNPVMTCRIELNHKIKEDKQLKKLIEDIFVEEVTKLNSEYEFVYKKFGEKVKPKIRLYEHGHPIYFPANVIKKTN